MLSGCSSHSLRFLSPGPPAMGASGVLFSILLLGGTLGLTTSPPGEQGQLLHCYTCGFSNPCYPVPTECKSDKVCGISVGTSAQNETIQRKGCLPRAQCALQGQAIYWLRAYVLRHECCEQDLCNVAAVPRTPGLLLTTLLLLVTSFAWGGHLHY